MFLDAKYAPAPRYIPAHPRLNIPTGDAAKALARMLDEEEQHDLAVLRRTRPGSLARLALQRRYAR